MLALLHSEMLGKGKSRFQFETLPVLKEDEKAFFLASWNRQLHQMIVLLIAWRIVCLGFLFRPASETPGCKFGREAAAVLRRHGWGSP